MPDIQGYKQVKYNDLIKSLKQHFDAQKKTTFTIAAELKWKSVSTVFNCMKSGKQKVTDEKLTTFAKHIHFDCCILMIGGQKIFYIQKEK